MSSPDVRRSSRPPKRKKIPGASSSHRPLWKPYTEQDDRHLIRFLSGLKPRQKSLFKVLEDERKPHYAWSKDHSWRGWYIRYRKYQAYFDFHVQRYQIERNLKVTVPVNINSKPPKLPPRRKLRVELDSDSDSDGSGGSHRRTNLTGRKKSGENSSKSFRFRCVEIPTKANANVRTQSRSNVNRVQLPLIDIDDIETEDESETGTDPAPSSNSNLPFRSNVTTGTKTSSSSSSYTAPPPISTRAKENPTGTTTTINLNPDITTTFSTAPVSTRNRCCSCCCLHRQNDVYNSALFRSSKRYAMTPPPPPPPPPSSLHRSPPPAYYAFPSRSRSSKESTFSTYNNSDKSRPSSSAPTVMTQTHRLPSDGISSAISARTYRDAPRHGDGSDEFGVGFGSGWDIGGGVGGMSALLSLANAEVLPYYDYDLDKLGS